MRDRLTALGWSEIEVIDDDLGRSAAGSVQRAGFERMVAQVCLGKVDAVAASEVSRFARNSRDWQQLIEMCRVVDTVLIGTMHTASTSPARACVKPRRSAPHLTRRRRPDLMTNVDGKHCPASSDCCPASVGPLSGLHRTAVRNQSDSLSAFAKNAHTRAT
jgi:hypothetical protein